MPRVRIVSIAAMIVLGACSGGDAAPAPTTVPPPPTSAPSIDEVAPSDTSPQLKAAVAEPPEEWSVQLDVTATGFDGGDVDTTVGWSGDPASLDSSDPFGEFAACSGWRERLGAYSVLVSDGGGLDAVSVWTADPVRAPGIYDAEVRIERAGSAPLEASGTMTILEGLQRGEFAASGAAGGRIDGTFSCAGTAAPLPLHDGDPESPTVEVFALLRQGDAERFLGLAADGSSGVVCDGATGAPTVDVDGDATVGGITAFELDAGQPATGRLRAGGATYELDDLTVVPDVGGAAGAFTGVSRDGVAIDGAFRCS